MEATGKINYTIIVDQSCYLYLNNQLIQKLEADKKIKLSLTPGEYNRKVVAIDNPSSLNEEKITISADKTFKDDIELCDVVDAVPVEVVPLVPKQEFKKHDIFISYRQRISNHKAEFLFTNLDSRFKNRVLRDLEEFELGRWINQIIYGV